MLITNTFIIGLLLFAAAPPGEQPSDHWAAQLGAARWQEREAASQRLLEIGKEAVPALERAIESKDPEVRHRAHLLLDRIRWQTDVALPQSLASAMEQFSSLADEQRLNLLTRVANELRDEAAPVLRRVLRTDPSTPVRRVALDRLIAIDPVSAEAELRQLADQPAGSPWAGAALGDLLTRLGKEDQAIAAYESSRKANPKDTQVAVSLARAYERRNDWAKARDLYAELAAARPDAVLYRMNLGRCLYRLGEQAKAETVWKGLLEARGAGSNAYLWLANTYQSVGAPDKALAILREGAEKNPHDMALVRYLASALNREGKTDEAIATYEKALRGAEVEHLRRATGFDLAYLLRQSGQLDAYLARQKAGPAEARPQGILLLRSLAESYLDMGDRAAAASVLRRFRALYPQGADAQWAAETLKRIGEKD